MQHAYERPSDREDPLQRFERMREEARRLASGQWLRILSALSRGQLDRAIEAGDDHVPCPVHGGVDGYRFFRHSNDTGASICNTCRPKRERGKEGFADGFETLMWVNDWGFSDAVKAVHEYCTGGSTELRPTARITPLKPKRELAPEDAKKLILEAWKESLPLTDPGAALALHYLREHRGLAMANLDLPEVRFHPNCFYRSKDGKVRASMPALLLRIRDVAGVPITLHRIYLDAEGRRARFEDAKKNMPHPRDRELDGGYVRLGPETPWLSLSEGFENGLSAREILGLPAGCANTKWALSVVSLPEIVRVVIIWGDHDTKGEGQAAAGRLAERLTAEGRQVLTLFPPADTVGNAKGTDWNDALRQFGLKALRESQWLAGIRERISEMSRVAGVVR